MSEDEFVDRAIEARCADTVTGRAVIRMAVIELASAASQHVFQSIAKSIYTYKNRIDFK